MDKQFIEVMHNNVFSTILLEQCSDVLSGFNSKSSHESDEKIVALLRKIHIHVEDNKKLRMRELDKTGDQLIKILDHYIQSVDRIQKTVSDLRFDVRNGAQITDQKLKHLLREINKIEEKAHII